MGGIIVEHYNSLVLVKQKNYSLEDIQKIFIQSDETFRRRSSTIKGWLNWIVGLINE